MKGKCCNTKLFVSVFILIMFFLFGMYPLNVGADDVTVVSVSPSTQSISSGDTFTVDVYCVPGQFIKSFELKLSFDASLIQANSVVEGDIFDGYSTFFNAGSIDNSAGTIVGIYDLIIGSDKVSDPGTFITISFTALSSSGISTIDIFDVGVTDDTGYVTISVTDGEATVIGENSSPAFSDMSPANQSTGISIGSSSLSLVINDADGDSFNWIIETSQDIGSNSGNGESSGSKSCSISGLSYGTTYHWYVFCVDIGSGSWNNKSYWFTTESYDDGGSGGGSFGGSGGGVILLPTDDDEQNNTSNIPPETPDMPSGPAFVEAGVVYTYSCSTYDNDSSQIRYMFKWGDGTYSEWSEFVSSNTSVTMSHSWSLIASYYVRVIAQDENGTNSSWSPPLEVVVSQIIGEGEEPIVGINISMDGSSNNLVSFDASGSYDVDGVIVSYEWDFGDGNVGSGVNPVHEYDQAGAYTVSLVITDNDGNVYTKMMEVVVESGVSVQDSEESGVPFIYYVGIIGIFLVVICVLVIFFRIKNSYSFSNKKDSDSLNNVHRVSGDKLDEIDAKLEEIRKKRQLIEQEKLHSEKLYNSNKASDGSSDLLEMYKKIDGKNLHSEKLYNSNKASDGSSDLLEIYKKIDEL